ncbi:hypothetical protein [Mesorhizobium wenxiniae]|uniref:Uncharacterized protein n=1 Tax=Mesorhizobium wenxiniae TaxID=2014805 RepID=A0A271K6K7_9HYPH|nr:hypothetical protein [Mesorhizobium wenxiniae]PAP91398.1 hypothetical protein CIT31_32505 [Mesorhizobium wenxiniae]
MSAVESIKDDLAKVVREMRLLKSEVAKLTATIKVFTDKHPLPERTPMPPDLKRHERVATSEPRLEIDEAIYQLRNANLDHPTQLIQAVAKQIDGALRDVRAARNQVEAIADDSDLREDWKAWQKTNG